MALTNVEFTHKTLDPPRKPSVKRYRI